MSLIVQRPTSSCPGRWHGSSGISSSWKTRAPATHNRLVVVRSIAFLFLGLLGLFRRGLFSYDPPAHEAVAVAVGRGQAGSSPGDVLDLLSWNIGYAALGCDADFVADGGRHLRAESRQTIEKNVAAVVDQLREHRSDVVLLQELARGGFMTRGVDVLSAVQQSMHGYDFVFAPSIKIEAVPLAGPIEVGQGTFSGLGISRATRYALESPSDFHGIRLQNFHVLESRLGDAEETGGWATFNVHMAAFDDGSVRREQLTEIIRLLEHAYAEGQHVVAGGDWNLRLATTGFPFTTRAKYTWWVRDLPTDLTPPGWQWGYDAAIPTNRTLEQPYRVGANYRSVIDGFLLSPNVEVVHVQTIDLEFANSDHNPVRMVVRKAHDTSD